MGSFLVIFPGKTSTPFNRARNYQSISGVRTHTRQIIGLEVIDSNHSATEPGPVRMEEETKQQSIPYTNVVFYYEYM